MATWSGATIGPSGSEDAYRELTVSALSTCKEQIDRQGVVLTVAHADGSDYRVTAPYLTCQISSAGHSKALAPLGPDIIRVWRRG